MRSISICSRRGLRQIRNRYFIERTVTCFNCGLEGHLAAHCPEERVRGPPEGKAVFDPDATHMVGQLEACLRALVPQKPTPCHLCGQTTHLRANCPESLCFACHRPGHQLRVCIPSMSPFSVVPDGSP